MNILDERLSVPPPCCCLLCTRVDRRETALAVFYRCKDRHPMREDCSHAKTIMMDGNNPA